MNSYFKRVALACVIFSCMASPLVIADQLEYKKTLVGDATQLTFRWKDRNEKNRGIIISVLNEDVSVHINDPKMKIKPQDIEGLLFSSVNKRAQEMSTEGYLIEIKKEGTTILINGTGPQADELNKRIKSVENANTDALSLLAKNSYFTLDGGSIRLDYKKIVTGSAEILSPIANYLRPEGADFRRTIESYLPFLQTIPYDKLDGSEDFGLYTPMHMLLTNRGDCESKQLALATMIRSQFPDTPLIGIGLVDHMLLGVAMTPQASDQTLMHKGKLYVLMDATGPKVSNIGELSSLEITRIRQGLSVVYPI
jgi:hypothetical protein